MFRLFLHTKVAGEGTNATIRDGSFMEAEASTLAEARKTARAILSLDQTVGRITIHRGTVVEDTVVR